MAHTTITIDIPSVLTEAQVREFKEILFGIMPAGIEIGHNIVGPKYTYEVKHDDDVESPREWSNVGILKLAHSRYNVADEGTPFVDDDWRANVLLPEVYMCLDVWGYEHGGLAMKQGERTGQFADTFDSGRLGWHFTTRERVQEHFPNQNIDTDEVYKKVYAVLEGELATYNSWLEGDTWRFVITDEEGDEVDACGGFIGDDALQSMLDNVGKEHQQGLREAWKERE